MKSKFAILVLFALCALVAGPALALELADVKCPVSGQDVKEESSASFKDGTIYFCCDGCPDVFAGDTANFENKAHHQLVMTGQYEQTQLRLLPGSRMVESRLLRATEPVSRKNGTV